MPNHSGQDFIQSRYWLSSVGWIGPYTRQVYDYQTAGYTTPQYFEKAMLRSLKPLRYDMSKSTMTDGQDRYDPDFQFNRTHATWDFGGGLMATGDLPRIFGEGTFPPSNVGITYANQSDLANRGRDAVLSKLADKAKRSKGNWALNAWPSELAKTVKSSIDLMRRMGDLAMAIRRRNLSQALRSFSDIKPRHRRAITANLGGKRAADLFLEMEYCWSPLMSDISDALKKDQRFLKNPIALVSAFSKYRQKYGPSNVLVDGSYYRFAQGEGAMLVRGKVAFAMADEGLNLAKSIGLTNPVDLAWEVVPFSFVADWFLPIGNFLNTLDAYLGLGFYMGDLTYYWSFRGDRVLRPNGTSIRGPDCLSPFRVTEMHREPMDSFQTPAMPHLKDLNKALSPKHVFDAIALLRTNLSALKSLDSVGV